MALPLLKPACDGIQALSDKIEAIEQQLRIALFLTGHTRVSEMKDTRWYTAGPASHMTHKKII
jgi:isopentenyl diphosphate isomerase/L-lactate dehydrogenase-like FMN-dependent dehydrogenase